MSCKARDSKFELLRIAAMLMIVVAHAMQHVGGGNCDAIWAPLSLNQAMVTLIGSWGQLGVSLFVIIALWFTIERETVRTRKLFVLVASTWFGGVAMRTVVGIAGGGVPL